MTPERKGDHPSMKICLRLALGICSLFFDLNLRAQEDDKPKDAGGCQDSPLITRFPGKIAASKSPASNFSQFFPDFFPRLTAVPVHSAI